MKVIIVEDERITAEDLKDIIEEVRPAAQVIKILSSVKEAVRYFKQNEIPDLIFSDIQLGDGLSFEIYQQAAVSIPIIFCTAYDEYALSAFKTNGIHYVLKPFDETSIEEAIQKFETFKANFTPDHFSINKVLEALQQKPEERQAAILVHQQDKVIPVKLQDIALFYIKNEVCHLYTFQQKTYYINKSLEEIQQLAGDDFYRANRQFILNRNAIKDVSQTLSRKVSVNLHLPFEETILVSKEKMTDFLSWLGV